MKKTYTSSDYYEASYAFNEAREQYQLKCKEQAKARAELVRTLDRLDKELGPYTYKRDEAARELYKLKQRLLGSWKIEGTQASIYVHGGPNEWYNRRVWLRLAKCCSTDWQWEVTIRHLHDAGNKDVLLGLPGADLQEDLQKHMLKVEAMLVKAGYILMGGDSK